MDKTFEELQHDLDTAAETFLGNENTTSEHDTIQFVSAGAQPPLEYDYKGISKLMVDVVSDQTHEIADFLARPVVIGTFDLGNWVTGRDVFARNIFDGIFSNKTIGDKLANFFSMRCTFCTKLVVNSQPYQTGIFYFSQRPYQIENAYSGDLKSHFPAYDDADGLPNSLLLIHKTGFPGTMVNISATSEETIKVPYVGVTPSVNLAAAFGNEVVLTCVSPLRQNDNGTHAYATIYAWLEDVDLIGTDPYPATAAWNLTPQGFVHKAHDVAKKTHEVAKLITGEAPAQSAEAEKGPVSKVADTVGGIAKTLSRIPVVADIAGPVSWACDAVSGIGSIFGFSKPNDTKHPKSFINDPMRAMPICDMPSTAAKLTVTKNAEVAVDSLGPVEVDEMMVAEIVKRPIIYEVTDWTTNNVRGTKLGEWNINPAEFQKTETVTINKRNWSYTALTFLGWLSSMFIWWRGGIKMTFAFAASQFHSGRIRFVVTINQSKELSSDNFDDPGHYSLIYDLRSGDTFTIEVPYLSYNYWRMTDTDVNDEKDVVLSAWVEGQLVADGRASDTVDIVVMPSGADDFAVAGPFTFPHGQVAYHSWPKTPAAAEAWELVPQGFDTNAATDNPQQDLLMYPRPPEHARVVATTQAIGDPVTSLRTLSKRYSFKGSLGVKEGLCAILPFQRFINQEVHGVTYLESIRAAYRFCRGGVRFLITGIQTDTTPIHFKLIPIQQLKTYDTTGIKYTNGIGQFVSTTDFENLTTIADLVVREDLKGCVEVEVPYYAKYAMLDNMPLDTPTGIIKWDQLPPTSASTVALVWHQPKTSTIKVFEAAADDFSTGYLIGPPIISHADD